MLTGKHKIYWIIRKLLGYLLLLEVVWLIINCVSPWRLWRNADIISCLHFTLDIDILPYPLYQAEVEGRW